MIINKDSPTRELQNQLHKHPALNPIAMVEPSNSSPPIINGIGPNQVTINSIKIRMTKSTNDNITLSNTENEYITKDDNDSHVIEPRNCVLITSILLRLGNRQIDKAQDLP